MNNITYRELLREDYERIKTLICEAFGFNEFIKDKKLLDSVLTLYLQGCILDSSFSQVAVKNNKVIGIILGDCKEDKTRLKRLHNHWSFLLASSKLLMSSKENKMVIKEFSKVQKTYKEIIKGKEEYFQGCIELFIVSKESRGLGVGKALVANLLDYMQGMHVNSFYLYTDDRCNYGFYDSQNFERINEKKLHFNSINAPLNVFLYSYKLN